MAKREFSHPNEMHKHVGEEIGVSDWVEVTQERIDQFAEATDKFKALGTTVIGMSNDNIDTLKKFSVEACRNKFAVGADAAGKVIKEYDVFLKMVPGTMADRVSFLIGTDGKVAAVHAAMDPDGHIDAMLKAAEKLKK